jgi:hypothetical protein
VIIDSITNAKAAAERGDFEAAIAILRPLAEAGNPEAQFQLGFLALTECELVPGREAFSLFQHVHIRGIIVRIPPRGTTGKDCCEPGDTPAGGR